MTINLGTNLNWNRTHSFTELRSSRSDPKWKGRIPDRILFTEDVKLIVACATPSLVPWWITAGRIIVEANFTFDSTSSLGTKITVYQAPILLRRSNLIWLEPYTFPYETNLTRFRITLIYQKWLDAISTEIFEFDP